MLKKIVSSPRMFLISQRSRKGPYSVTSSTARWINDHVAGRVLLRPQLSPWTWWTLISPVRHLNVCMCYLALLSSRRHIMKDWKPLLQGRFRTRQRNLIFTYRLLLHLNGFIIDRVFFWRVVFYVCRSVCLVCLFILPPIPHRVSLCSPDCARTRCLDQAGLGLSEIHLPLLPKCWD